MRTNGNFVVGQWHDDVSLQAKQHYRRDTSSEVAHQIGDRMLATGDRPGDYGIEPHHVPRPAEPAPAKHKLEAIAYIGTEDGGIVLAVPVEEQGNGNGHYDTELATVVQRISKHPVAIGVDSLVTANTIEGVPFIRNGRRRRLYAASELFEREVRILQEAGWFVFDGIYW